MLGPDDTRPCPRCGREQGTTAYPIPEALQEAAGAPIRHFWSVCTCEEERMQLQQAHQEAATEAHRQALQRALMNYDGLRDLEHMQLRAFNPARLRPRNGSHPYDVAVAWLGAVRETPRAEDRGGPPMALWFYCPNPGRGKTHLAAGLALELRAAGHAVSFLSARTYLDYLWAAPFELRQQIREYPGARAHLTVVDDLGRVGNGDGAAAEWDKLVDRRLVTRRWLIVTSQETPEALLRRGAILDSTASRLQQMTRGMILYFDGDDQRQAGAWDRGEVGR